MEDDNLEPWIYYFKKIMEIPPPLELNTKTGDTDEINKRNKTVLWKMKGMIAKTMYLMFVKCTQIDEFE